MHPNRKFIAMKNCYILLMFVSFLLACSGNSEPEDVNNELDTLQQDLAEDEPQTDAEAEMQQLMQAEEEPEDTGPSFCECVKKQDALNEKMMDAETDDEIRAVQKEMNELVTGECKKILAANIVSKDQQEAHKRKVKACLGK